MKETLREGLFRINLGGEEHLWENVTRHARAKVLLEAAGCNVLILGTDRQLSLAKLVLEKPTASVTVIEMNPEVIESARQHIPLGREERLTLIEGRFPYVQLPAKYRIVLAKNLIHFHRAPRLVAEVMEILEEGGLFFANTPPICGLRPWVELKLLGKTRRWEQQSDDGILNLLLKRAPFIFEKIGLS